MVCHHNGYGSDATTKLFKVFKITIQNIYGWFFIGDEIFLLYGDVVRIVEIGSSSFYLFWENQ